MELYGGWFVDKWRNKCMNIHPSLLPDFPGMDLDVHKAVIESGRKVSGCTLFFIDEGADTGPIIMQKSVEVKEDETIDSLRAKVQKEEQKMYPRGIRLYAERKLRVEGRNVIILDKCY